VLPYAEPVLISPPLIPVWRAHGSTFPLWSGREGDGRDEPVPRHREYNRSRRSGRQTNTSGAME